MPLTRVKKKKPDPDSEEAVEAERINEIAEYLKQFEMQVQCQSDSMNKQMADICEKLMTQYTVRLMQIPKHIRQMALKEYFDLGDIKTEDPEIESPMVELQRPKRWKKKNINSSLKTKSTVKLTSRKRPRADTATPLNTKIKNDLNGFTPKFDPRKPITPASGLRSIKPGEKFVLMSMSGSPLLAEETTAGFVLDADGRTMQVTVDMGIPAGLDEDTKNKIALIQKKLARKSNT